MDEKLPGSVSADPGLPAEPAPVKKEKEKAHKEPNPTVQKEKEKARKKAKAEAAKAKAEKEKTAKAAKANVEKPKIEKPKAEKSKAATPKAEKPNAEKPNAEKPKDKKASAAEANQAGNQDGMYVAEYPMAQIVLPVLWNRKKARGIKELSESISKQGQLLPLMLALCEDGTTELLEGRRRFLARQMLGLETAPVIIKDQDPKNTTLTALAVNVCREPHTPYELVMQCDRLIKEGVTIADIAKALGRTASNISQHVLALRHDPRLLDALEKETIPLIAFRVINKINPENDPDFYEKMVLEFLAGTAVTAVELKIDSYLERKQEKKAKDAASSGKKAPEVKRVGGAAHKKNKRDIKVFDYADAEVKKASRMLSKETVLSTATEWVEKLRKTTTKDKTKFMEGALWAVDYVLGLREEN